MARCVGIKRDVRLNHRESYSNYNLLNFKSFISFNGDCFDRFLIRMYEMSESLNIVNQCISYLSNTIEISAFTNETIKNKTKEKKKNYSYQYMEDLIEHFVN